MQTVTKLDENKLHEAISKETTKAKDKADAKEQQDSMRREFAPMSVKRRWPWQRRYQGDTTKPFQRDNLGMTILPPIPFQMTQWRVAVLVIKPAKRSAGGIEFVEETIETEVLMSSIGILVSKGYHAFKSKTRAKIDLNAEPLNPNVGDYVLFTQHSGNLVRVRGTHPETGEPADIEFRIMNDSEILGVTRHPHVFRYYL